MIKMDKTVTANQNVIVNDNTKPNAVAKNATVIFNSSGSASITTADVNNGSTDNCGAVTTSISPSAFNCTNVAGVSSAGNAMSFNGGYIDVPNEASLNPAKTPGLLKPGL